MIVTTLFVDAFMESFRTTTRALSGRPPALWRIPRRSPARNRRPPGYRPLSGFRPAEPIPGASDRSPARGGSDGTRGPIREAVRPSWPAVLVIPDTSCSATCRHQRGVTGGSDANQETARPGNRGPGVLVRLF